MAVGINAEIEALGSEEEEEFGVLECDLVDNDVASCAIIELMRSSMSSSPSSDGDGPR